LGDPSEDGSVILNKIDLKGVMNEDVIWIHGARYWVLMNMVMNLWVP
jgi:hypothetical protein